MKATRMPDGIYVFDEPVKAKLACTNVILEGFYFNQHGDKCYLFQFPTAPTVEDKYSDANGIKDWAFRTTHSEEIAE